MPPDLSTPPERVCILRLSALGDTCHVVPVLRALQRAWPATRFSWVIGKLESRLMGLLPDVELITVDKRAGLAGLKDLRARVAGRRFDVLLHMQLALRASACAMAIPARVKLGFDRARARELQWLFTNRRIAARSREHVLDSFFGFAEALGVHGPHVPHSPADWALPLPEEAQRYARDLIPDGRATLLISPASSHALRNWDASRYARVADHAARELGLAVILCGGPSAIEKTLGAQIVAACHTPPLNQIGRDTLPQMQALLARASVLLAPDSGPAHMATLAGTPVLGLYAATNPARSGPYLSRQWCIDRYDEAARRFCGRPAAQLPWTTKIERPGVMDLIGVEEVQARLHEMRAAGLLASRQ